MSKPLLIDLFCGAGGASMGYHRAGFEVIGVDHEPMPRYPFEFVQGDVFEVWDDLPHDRAAAYAASPPCQAFSLAAKQWRHNGRVYADLVSKMRDLLVATDKPYVIENVPGAPLINPTVLNGAYFGMNLRRTRWFETSFPLPFILLPKEGPSRFRMGRRSAPHDPVVPVGHFSGVERARLVMELPGMTQAELSQAIPPAYTEWIGRHLMAVLS